MAGGGVGEAMLIGAAVGAGTGGVMSAVKDEDPLQGALLGAALGAAGGGIGSWAGGAAAGAEAGAGSAAIPGAASSAAPGAASSAAPGAIGTEATSQLGQQALQNAATTQGVAIPQGYQLGTGTLGNQVAASQGFEPLATGTGFTEDVITKAAAPQSWGQQGIGQGFAPHLTNAQAYGAGAGGGIMGLIGQSAQNQNNMAPEPEPYTGSLSYFKYSPQTFRPSVAPGYADGGIASLGPQTGMYPQSQYDKTQFATPSQMPISREVIGSDYDARISPYSGDIAMARGGISSLGSYSDGGRMLKGPGDGMSDDIPGVIAGKQPARLADGEFVVPADVVSHLGNGSTDAGAKKLYSMMDNVRKARTGTKRQGKQIKADKYVPGMAHGGVAHYEDGGTTSDETPAWFSNWLATQSEQPRPGMGTISPSFQPTGYTPSQQYTPYTMSGRPSSSEPQFYGNIYQPTYENYASPNYDMNAGLGRWSNMPPKFDEQLYLQQKMQQLGGLPSSAQTRMFDEPAYLQNKLQQLQGTEYANYSPQQLKDFISSQGMTLPQHYERWGMAEGIANPYRDYTAPELRTAISQAGMSLPEHYQLYGREEGLNPYANAPQVPSLAADIASTQAAKEEPAKTEKKRRGGIASLVS